MNVRIRRVEAPARSRAAELRPRDLRARALVPRPAADSHCPPGDQNGATCPRGPFRGLGTSSLSIGAIPKQGLCRAPRSGSELEGCADTKPLRRKAFVKKSGVGAIRVGCLERKEREVAG